MKNLDQVNKYAIKISQLINLKHWEIRFTECEDGKKCEHEEDAHCNQIFNYKDATITIHKKFWDANENLQKKIIIHELLHCHFAFWEEPFKEHFDDWSLYAKNSIVLAKNCISSAEEESVELLARAIYNLIES